MAAARKALISKGARSTSSLRGVTHHVRTRRWESHVRKRADAGRIMWFNIRVVVVMVGGIDLGGDWAGTRMIAARHVWPSEGAPSHVSRVSRIACAQDAGSHM